MTSLGHGTYHIVCHTCGYETVVEGAQVDAAFERDDHRHTHKGHDVELAYVDGPDVRTYVGEGARGQTLLLGDGETREQALDTGRWIETDRPADAPARR